MQLVQLATYHKDVAENFVKRHVEASNLRSQLAGYHGTRLTDDEVRSVRKKGLLPLDASVRRARLVRTLSPHSNWNTAAQRLDAVLKELGPLNRAGRREGQAHLTLSRAGLVNGFNHYLTHGSEFDQRAAHALLGDDGSTLLAGDGKGMVIQFAVPGHEALKAAHPNFSVEYIRARGEVPNIAKEFLNAWSYQVAHSDFDPRTLWGAAKLPTMLFGSTRRR